MSFITLILLQCNPFKNYKTNIGLYQWYTSMQFYYRIYWYCKILRYKVWGAKHGAQIVGVHSVRTQSVGAQSMGAKFRDAKWVNPKLKYILLYTIKKKQDLHLYCFSIV